MSYFTLFLKRILSVDSKKVTITKTTKTTAAAKDGENPNQLDFTAKTLEEAVAENFAKDDFVTSDKDFVIYIFVEISTSITGESK